MNSLINDLQLNQINASRFNEVDTNYKGVKSTYSMKPNSLNSPFMNRNPQTINVTNIPRITERKTVLPYHTQTKRKSNYNSEGLYQIRNGTQHPNDEYFHYLNDNRRREMPRMVPGVEAVLETNKMYNSKQNFQTPFKENIIPTTYTDLNIDEENGVLNISSGYKPNLNNSIRSTFGGNNSICVDERINSYTGERLYTSEGDRAVMAERLAKGNRAKEIRKRQQEAYDKLMNNSVYSRVYGGDVGIGKEIYKDTVIGTSGDAPNNDHYFEKIKDKPLNNDQREHFYSTVVFNEDNIKDCKYEEIINRERERIINSERLKIENLLKDNKYNIEFVQDIPILEISEYNKSRLQQLHEMRLREGITDDYIEKYAKIYADIIVNCPYFKEEMDIYLAKDNIDIQKAKEMIRLKYNLSKEDFDKIESIFEYIISEDEEIQRHLVENSDTRLINISRFDESDSEDEYYDIDEKDYIIKHVNSTLLKSKSDKYILVLSKSNMYITADDSYKDSSEYTTYEIPNNIIDKLFPKISEKNLLYKCKEISEDVIDLNPSDYYILENYIKSHNIQPNPKNILTKYHQKLIDNDSIGYSMTYCYPIEEEYEVDEQESRTTFNNDQRLNQLKNDNKNNKLITTTETINDISQRKDVEVLNNHNADPRKMYKQLNSMM